MLILTVVISPITEPSFLISTRSRAFRLPSTLPQTTTSRACTSELSFAVGPIVSLCPWSEIEPSTVPAICRSSLPEMSPLTTRFAPKHATSRELGVLERVAGVALPGLMGAPGTCTEDVPGKSACGCLLVHILPPYSDPNQELYRAGETCVHCTMSLQVVAILFSRGVALLRNCPPAQPEQENILYAFASVENSARALRRSAVKTRQFKESRVRRSCGDGPTRRVTVAPH